MTLESQFISVKCSLYWPLVTLIESSADLRFLFCFLSATHEKGFILYLTSSHTSFLIVLKIYHIIWPVLDCPQRNSYRKKLFTFVFSFICLVLMGYFYYRHIVHCDSLGKFHQYWYTDSMTRLDEISPLW